MDNLSVISIVSDLEKSLHKLKDLLESNVDLTHDRVISTYGDSVIRVHWMYVDNARKNPNLKKVCCWPNGDEGFVLKTEGE